MKKFSRFELDSRDWITLVISFFVFAIASLSLVWDVGFSEESDREIVGTVVYRNRVAQRRLSSSVLWQNVEQEEEVRNFDSIRTDRLAEAIITLTNGTKVELDPLSMIVLHIRDQETLIELERGSLLVTPGSTGDVRIQKGKYGFSRFVASLRIFGNETEDIQLFSESKVQINASGTIHEIEGGSKVTIQSDRIEDRGFPIKVYAPSDNMRYFVNPGQKLEVRFHWDNPLNKEMVILFGEDPFLTSNVKKHRVRDGHFRLDLPPGNYYWQIQTNEGESSQTLRFKIKERSQIAIMEPIDDETILIEEGGLVPFAWTDTELAVNYRLELSTDLNFEKPLLSMISKRSGLSVVMPEGRFYTRVVAKGNLPGSDEISPTVAFTVLRPKSLPKDNPIAPEEPFTQNQPTRNSEVSPPVEIQKQNENRPVEGVMKVKESVVPIYPRSSVDMAGKNQLVFRWKSVPNARKYEFIFREEKSGGKELLQREVNRPEFVLTDLSILDIGNFSWEAIAVLEDGSKISTNRVRFRILLSEHLDAPELKL